MASTFLSEQIASKTHNTPFINHFKIQATLQAFDVKILTGDLKDAHDFFKDWRQLHLDISQRTRSLCKKYHSKFVQGHGISKAFQRFLEEQDQIYAVREESLESINFSDSLKRLQSKFEKIHKQVLYLSPDFFDNILYLQQLSFLQDLLHSHDQAVAEKEKLLSAFNECLDQANNAKQRQHTSAQYVFTLTELFRIGMKPVLIQIL